MPLSKKKNKWYLLAAIDNQSHQKPIIDYYFAIIVAFACGFLIWTDNIWGN